MSEYSAIAIDREEDLILARVFDFTRYRRKQRKVPRRQWRLLNAPWQPLAALVGVAGALWFAAALPPNIMNGNGAGAMNGNGVFALCVGARQQNCVIDGDTIRYGGTKIRLEDIDAPETFSPKCAAEAALGWQATRRLLELMNAGPFRVVDGGRDTDRYGRKLRVIERGGRSVGEVLIAEGLARRWDGARRSWCG
jgi:endonuclease YncB( thermonuclease family)